MGAIQKVSYEVSGQTIELTPATVKQYLVNGGGNVSDQEVGMFIKICEGQKLNPFLREAYLIKYGTQPASIIVGKEAFTKRAENNPAYKGNKAGIIVINLKKEIEYREGTFYLKDREDLVGGWARVFFKDGKEDLFNTVSLDEYIGRKKDGTINTQWATKPATMIKKVALVQALRDAFPRNLGQMYISEEMNFDDKELPTDPINPIKEQVDKEHVEEPPKLASKTSKHQVMQLALEKGLVNGEGKNANIEKLEELANSKGISLRGMTEDQANELIHLLMEYSEPPVVDVPEENIKPVNEENKNEEIVNATNNTVVEEEPF